MEISWRGYVVKHNYVGISVGSETYQGQEVCEKKHDDDDDDDGDDDDDENNNNNNNNVETEDNGGRLQLINYAIR